MDIPDLFLPNIETILEIEKNTAEIHNERALTEIRISMILKPRLLIDGDMWCALYGEDQVFGVAGFGTSPEKAYQDFDRAWNEDLKKGVPE